MICPERTTIGDIVSGNQLLQLVFSFSCSLMVAYSLYNTTRWRSSSDVQFNVVRFIVVLRQNTAGCLSWVFSSTVYWQLVTQYDEPQFREAARIRLWESGCDLRTEAGGGTYRHGGGGQLKRSAQASARERAIERSSSFKPGANRYGWVMDLDDEMVDAAARRAELSVIWAADADRCWRLADRRVRGVPSKCIARRQ